MSVTWKWMMPWIFLWFDVYPCFLHLIICQRMQPDVFLCSSFNILYYYGLMLCPFWSNDIGPYMLEMLCLLSVILAQILAWWPSGPHRSPFHLSQKTQSLMQHQSPRLTSQPSVEVCLSFTILQCWWILVLLGSSIHKLYDRFKILTF